MWQIRVLIENEWIVLPTTYATRQEAKEAQEEGPCRFCESYLIFTPQES